jgi:hypothetical protein
MVAMKACVKKVKIDKFSPEGDDESFMVRHYRINLEDSITKSWFSYHVRLDHEGFAKFGWSKSTLEQIEHEKDDIDGVQSQWDAMDAAMGKTTKQRPKRISRPVSMQYVADELYRMGADDAIQMMQDCIAKLMHDLTGKCNRLSDEGDSTLAWLIQAAMEDETKRFLDFDASW